MTTSPTFADNIGALMDRLDRIERALGLGVSQDSGASLQRGEALLNAERDLNVLEATLGHDVEGPVDLVDFLTKLGKVQAHLLQDSIRVLGHGSPHSSVTGTPEGSDSAGSPSGDPAESCTEPTGLGAVVRAGNGEVYIRPKLTTTHRHWRNARGMTGHATYTWSDLPRPLTVLSPGCQFLPSGYAEGEYW